MWYSVRFGRLLSKGSPALFLLVAGLCSFLAYACVYAFRKPFAAASYSGLELWGISFKIVLVTAQVAGYALSKFIGIRIISGMRPKQRAGYLLVFVGLAGLSLLGFALTPFPWNAIWMFVNGLPLSMAWGLVFSYVEGRRVTEMLAALLCANFIFSSGLVKTVGKHLQDEQHFSEWWMPFTTAMLFTPAFLVAVWGLEHLPPPTKADERQRVLRRRMNPSECRTLFLRYASGLMLLAAAYLMLTIIRDVRDNFAVELWAELGYKDQAMLLTASELPVALLSLPVIGALIFIPNNFKALWTNHIIGISGGLLLAGGTLAFQLGYISAMAWMIVSGLGLFLAYILFNGILFDRLMASFREEGNVGFLVYFADAIGYLGSVAVLWWRNFAVSDMRWLDFYFRLCYCGAAVCVVLMLFSWIYFYRKRQTVQV